MADSFVFANRAVSALQSAIDQFATTAFIGIDDIDRFPELVGGSKFPIILSNREDEYEVCYVTALTETGEMTIERAREDTAALSWSAGTFVEHCLTAGSFLAAARLVPKGEWDETVNYLPGDVVVYTDISYIATAASLNQVPSSASPYWQILYQPPGVSSTALNWSGDWNSGTTYAVGAYVRYNGRLWVAIAAGQNHLPTDPAFWYPLGTPTDPTIYDEVLTASGTNNYTVAPDPAPASLYNGLTLSVIFPNSNTAPSTLTIGALAPIPLRPKKSVEFASGEIIANVPYEFTYFLGTTEFVVKSAPVFEKKIADLQARTTVIENYKKYVPVGTRVGYLGDVAPAGWLLCYGQTVSQVTYADLYAVCGTKFNVGGEPAGTFRLPDYRGRTGVGKEDMGGVSAALLGATIVGTTLGAKGGAATHTLTEAQMPSHIHGGVTGNASTGPVYDRFGDNGSATVAAGGAFEAQAAGDNVATATTSFNHTHPLTITATGGGQAHNNLQPSIIENVMVFAGA